MRYLVASTGANLEAKVDNRFGFPRYHLLVDSFTMEFKSCPGTEEQPFLGLEKFEEEEIEGAISGNYGPDAFNELWKRRIPAYLCRGMTVRQAVQRVDAGEFEPLSAPSMKFNIHGQSESKEDRMQKSGIIRGRYSGLKKDEW
jgi:predicted Fe-Mo cluster-binding NifX family protein